MPTQSESRMDDALFTLLNLDGTLIDKRLEPAISPDDLKRLYELMVLTRVLDDRLLRMQRQGRIGFYITSLGEEAAHIGSAFALGDEDWVFPQYRESSAAFLRGYPLYEYICQMFGNSGDILKGRQLPSHYAYRKAHYLSTSSPVATQIPQAVGFAWGAKIKKEKLVTLVYFGDGATSHQDFHMGLNFAGVFKVPVVFFCKNNQWAISVPFNRQTASQTVAVKATAYGLEGIRVDGNDMLAVISATRKAVEKAKNGGGAALIEAVTYRMGPHSTSDDPRIYADESKLKEWGEKDPIVRFRKYLATKGLWTESYEHELMKKVQDEITDTIKRAEKNPPPPLVSMFEEVYAEMPQYLKEEYEEAAKFYHGE